jgi:uncharacterized membrane protein YqaE (UPF0057 family)
MTGLLNQGPADHASVTVHHYGPARNDSPNFQDPEEWNEAHHMVLERLHRPNHDPKGRPMDIVRILLAILLPPLGVFLQVGLGLQFWVNILLTLLGYIPGIIHAIYIIIKYK